MRFLLLLLILSQIAEAAPSRSVDHVVSNSLAVGTIATANSKAVVDMVSTTKGFLPPRMTQAQRDAIATPPTGLTVLNSDTKQYNVYDGSVWQIVGTGSSGAGGINFIASGDQDAETSLGAWATYKDAAGVSPVDGTGGSPTIVSITRITSPAGEILHGSGSFKLTKTASSCQGEGASVAFTIPNGYTAKNTQISFPYKVTSGSIIQGDFKAFIYDVTNASVTVPAYNDILGGAGTLTAVFGPSTTSNSYRLILHCASTTTTAATISFDDVSVSPFVVPIGLAGTDALAYTPTFAGMGTTSSPTFTYRRAGDNLVIEGKVTLGTTAASLATITLPAGLSLDTAKVPSGTSHAGSWAISSATATVPKRGTVLRDASNPTLLYFSLDDYNNAVSALTAQNGSALWPNAVILSVQAQIPISGWSANVQMASSSQYKVSSYLVSGSRVTGSAPTVLGQYRSYLRQANANTFTETSGDPTSVPSVADGIAIYSGGAYNAADASNKPSHYDIFVGKNKSVKALFYSGTGRTGQIDVTPTNGGASNLTDVGFLTAYDPTTGIFSVSRPTNSSSATTHVAGMDMTGIRTNATAGTAAYFDVIVSENALSIGQDITNPISTCSNCRIESAKVSCYASSGGIVQLGSWLSAVTPRTTAKCSVTIQGGIFTAAPYCWTTRVFAATASEYVDVNPTSTTNVDTYSSSAADYDAMLFCMGPK